MTLPEAETVTESETNGAVVASEAEGSISTLIVIILAVTILPLSFVVILIIRKRKK